MPLPSTKPRLSIRPRLRPFRPLDAALWALHHCDFLQLNIPLQNVRFFFRFADLATPIKMPMPMSSLM